MAGKEEFEVNNRGFALVVIALILLVAGALIITRLGTQPVSELKNTLQTQNKKMAAIKNAVYIYYGKNSTSLTPVIPAPASLTATSGATYLTSVTTCSSGCTSASDNSNIWIGGVPTRTLDLPDSYAFDDWGNRLIYAIDTTGSNAITLNDITPATINVYDNSTVPVLNPGGKGKVSAVIVSAGKTGKGAYTKNGTLFNGVACASSTTTDGENCNNDSIFIANPQTANFDDLTAYVALSRCPAGVMGCRLWLDANDPNYITLYYINDAITGTTATGTAGAYTLTLNADIRTYVKIGTRIRLGTSGSITKAAIMGADTYTVSAITAGNITTVEPLTANYSASTVNRGLVYIWNDKSGYGTDFTQTSGVNRLPVWDTSSDFNNVKVVDFLRSGTEDFLALLASNPKYTSFNNDAFQTGNYWVQVGALRRTFPTGTGGDTYSSILGRPALPGIFFDGTSTANYKVGFAGYDGSGTFRNTTIATAALNTAYILGGGFSKSGSNYTPTVAKFGTVATAAAFTSMQSSTNGYQIGISNPTGGVCELDGVIAEIIIYPFSLTTTQRKKVECYQADKWNLCANLPSGGATYCNGLGAPVAYCGAATP